MKKDTQSFIVRLWSESEAKLNNQPIWRGVIEHVGSSERLHFKDVEAMIAFLKKQTGYELKLVAPPWRDWWARLRKPFQAALDE